MTNLYVCGRRAVCLLTLTAVVGNVAWADTDAADYFDGKAWGWASCSDESGTAYQLDGGMRAAQPSTIVLTSNGGDNASAIKAAIAQYDIVVLDGSAGQFTIASQMAISNAVNKTIVGRNNAVLATQFYLTDSDIAYLKSQGLEGLSSTDQYTGTLPDGTTLTCDRRAFFTKKALMELQYQKTGAYTLPNNAGIFMFDATCQNVIVRNLTLQGPGAVDIDGADLLYDAYATHLWVDHCTFIDSQDGALDTRGGWNTYTWNHFYYTSRSYSHAYTCGLGWVSNHSDVLHVTWGYNIWGKGCQRRLPQADDAWLHLVNNYHNCAGNSVGMTLNTYVTALVEGNYAASGVNSPLTGSGENRYIYARNNSFSYTSTSTSVAVPYAYATPISCADVPTVLTAAHGAGATLDDMFMPLGYNTLDDATFGFYATSCDVLLGNDVFLPIRNYVGARYTLTSSDPSVVEVGASGALKAVGVGSATLTATVSDELYGSFTATVTVNVTQPSEFQTIMKWDFSTFSSATKGNLSADAALWTSDGSSYTNASALNGVELTANGAAIAEAEGLTFTSTASKLQIYGSGRIRLNKEGSIIALPELQRDDKVLVTWKSANSSAQRGFTTNNLSVASMLTDGNQKTGEAWVVADGPVSLAVSGGGIYVVSIEVQRQSGASGIGCIEVVADGSSAADFDLSGRQLPTGSAARGLRVRGGRVVLVK
ncbi:MAG: hypothetical protein K6E73_00455 [Bacteroidales bacterium]|nr:hypothetical protein [Bacteroidales bacterium]